MTFIVLVLFSVCKYLFDEDVCYDIKILENNNIRWLYVQVKVNGEV